MVPKPRVLLLRCRTVRFFLVINPTTALMFSREDRLEFFIPPNLPSSLYTFTKNLLAPATLPPQLATPSLLKWTSSSDPEKPALVIANRSGLTKQIAWHARGDYFATVCTFTPDRCHIGRCVDTNLASDGGVWIHQVTKRHSQSPFKRIKGTVQMVLFHPKKPNFFVAVWICRVSSPPATSDTTPDTDICEAVQPFRTEVNQNPNAGYQMDLIDERAPIRGSHYRRGLR